MFRTYYLAQIVAADRSVPDSQREILSSRRFNTEIEARFWLDGAFLAEDEEACITKCEAVPYRHPVAA